MPQRARPPSVEVDPRTQLPLVDVPPSLLPAFQCVQGAIVHWVGAVRKVNSTHREVPRVAVVGDAALYVMDLHGAIKRCVLYQDLQDLVVRDQDDAIGFRHASSDKVCDLLLRFDAGQSATVLGYITRIYWVHMARELSVVRLSAVEAIDPQLMLAKPAGYTLKIEPLRSKKYLEKLLRDQQVQDQRNEERVAAEFVRLKGELLRELERQRNAQYDRMVANNMKLIAELQRANAEIAELRRSLSTHRPFFDHSVAIEASAAPPPPPPAAAAAAAAAKPVVEGTDPSLGGGPTQDGEARGSGGGGRGATIEELRRIIEEHPNTDKKRVLIAEEKLAGTTRVLEKAMRENAPLREEVGLLRGTIAALDVVLRDQTLSLQERVRASLEITGPHAAAGDTATSRIGGPLSRDIDALRREVQCLRGLLRDAHAIHDAELRKVHEQFRGYEEHMIEVVRDALDCYTPEGGVPNSLSAQRLVQAAKTAPRRRAGSPKRDVGGGQYADQHQRRSSSPPLQSLRSGPNPQVGLTRSLAESAYTASPPVSRSDLQTQQQAYEQRMPSSPHSSLPPRARSPLSASQSLHARSIGVSPIQNVIGYEQHQSQQWQQRGDEMGMGVFSPGWRNGRDGEQGGRRDSYRGHGVAPTDARGGGGSTSRGGGFNSEPRLTAGIQW